MARKVGDSRWGLDNLAFGRGERQRELLKVGGARRGRSWPAKLIMGSTRAKIVGEELNLSKKGLGKATDGLKELGEGQRVISVSQRWLEKV